MNTEKDKVYIVFHKGNNNLLGALIAAWTFGKYSHVEFLVNDTIYYTNPGGGVRKKPFEYKKHMDIFELPTIIDYKDIIEWYEYTKGMDYDMEALVLRQILGRFLWFADKKDDNKYFCSEWCLNGIYYAHQFSLTYKFKALTDKYDDFSPNKLYRYLKDMEMLGEKMN